METDYQFYSFPSIVERLHHHTDKNLLTPPQNSIILEIHQDQWRDRPFEAGATNKM